GAIDEMFGDALEPLRIHERDLRSGVDKTVLELRPGPPRIQRRDDRADQHGAIEHSRPFRQVAHNDGDAVALLHAELRQLRRDRKRGTGECLVRAAIVLVYKELAIAVGAAREKDFTLRRRRVLPDAGLDAADDGLVHLEARAGRGEEAMRLGKGDSGPRLRSGSRL